MSQNSDSRPGRTSGLPALLIAVAMLCSAAACGPTGDAAPSPREGRKAPEPRELGLEIVATYPHDEGAYTQGLEWIDGWLYESTGQHGRSSVRRYRPGDEEPDLVHQLPADLFGEGLTAVEGKIYQLTWMSGKTLVYEPETLELVQELQLVGEGWGLAYDGSRLIVSEGTHVLRFHDPKTLERVSRKQIKRRGSPLAGLNELELVGPSLYANVYQTDEIVEIEVETGHVVSTIDASGLLTAEEMKKAEVLNGIAYRKESQTFFITGKHWPHLFEVRFVPIDEASVTES